LQAQRIHASRQLSMIKLPPAPHPASVDIADRFASDGFVLLPALLDRAECDAILAQLIPASGAVGSRSLLPQAWCHRLAERLRQHSALAGIIPAGHIAVQCTYFEKTTGQNWLVPIHQDLSIPVARHVANSELKGWSDKEGSLFVQAPDALLAQLVALRLHLDACGAEDGPLRVVPGSHRAGRVTAEMARTLRGRAGELACLAGRGDLLALRPLLLHASSKSGGSGRRRVLHFLFGPGEIGYGLQWPELV
jgi:hypothetical protein